VNRHHTTLANDILREKKRDVPPFIVSLEPEKLTERMSRQQGLFVMPTSIRRSFMDNLTAPFTSAAAEVTPERDFKPKMYSLNELKKDEASVLKIVIPKQLHNDIIADLTQMNISSETLFPGLDGFARSLAQTVVREGI